MSQTRFRALRASMTDRPDAIEARSQVTVIELDRVAKLSHDFTDYQVLTIRIPGDHGGEFTAFVTHVDADGVGHEWMLPGRVVAAIARHMDALNKRNRKARAKQVFATAAMAEQRPGLRTVS